MRATIWHHPRCSKSRTTLALLEDAGAEVTVVEYLKHPPTAAELARLYDRAGITPREGLRGDAPPLEEANVLAAMEAEPALIKRPLVETELGVRLCRRPERVREIPPAE